MKVVKIRVSGGLVQNVDLTGCNDLEVKIYDYDIEGCDRALDLDEDGEECIISTYSNKN